MSESFDSDTGRPKNHKKINSYKTGTLDVPVQHDMCDLCDPTFPGPLLSINMVKENLLAFIKEKYKGILQHLEQPEHQDAYFFWKLMELLCNREVCEKARMWDIAICLTKAYERLIGKAPNLVCQREWCLSLVDLLFNGTPDEELKQATLQMAKDLAFRGQTFAAHICRVVALLEQGTYNDSSLDLIGCVSLPLKKSAIREAIERSEVYEYVLFMTSGIIQPSFQKYKAFYANMLATEGLSSLALGYCESIARVFTTFPSCVEVTALKEIFLTSMKLHQGETKEPGWLDDLRSLYTANMENNYGYPKKGKLKDFKARYICEEKLLGQGSFGSVYAGVCMADSKLIAIKFVAKTDVNEYIPIPGETGSLPLEVALMQIVSNPPHCDNVVKLLEWFEMTNLFVLVLEHPSQCVNLFEFCESKGPLPEPLTRDIMRQVVQAASHCCDRGVLHRDIKPENLLINTETMQVKMIDFGCGDLLVDLPYSQYAGTPYYCPPEWIKVGQYMGRPATVWSLGILMYWLVCGKVPFKNYQQIVYKHVKLHRDMSKDFHHLVKWCLKKNPKHRATLKDIMDHVWFNPTLDQKKKRRKEKAKPTEICSKKKKRNVLKYILPWKWPLWKVIKERLKQ